MGPNAAQVVFLQEEDIWTQTEKERRLCEDIGRRQSFTSQGE